MQAWVHSVWEEEVVHQQLCALPARRCRRFLSTALACAVCPLTKCLLM